MENVLEKMNKNKLAGPNELTVYIIKELGPNKGYLAKGYDL